MEQPRNIHETKMGAARTRQLDPKDMVGEPRLNIFNTIINPWKAHMLGSLGARTCISMTISQSELSHLHRQGGVRTSLPRARSLRAQIHQALS
jgi:hypothetical protein